MATLGRRAEKTEALLPERVDGFLDLAPRHLDIADGTQVRIHLIRGNAIVIRTNVGTGRDNDVWKIGSRLSTLPVHHEVLAIIDGLG